jgi:hypothetical protein
MQVIPHLQVPSVMVSTVQILRHEEKRQVIVYVYMLEKRKHVDSLLSNDRKISNYTTAAAK